MAITTTAASTYPLLYQPMLREAVVVAAPLNVSATSANFESALAAVKGSILFYPSNALDSSLTTVALSKHVYANDTVTPQYFARVSDLKLFDAQALVSPMELWIRVNTQSGAPKQLADVIFIATSKTVYNTNTLILTGAVTPATADVLNGQTALTDGSGKALCLLVRD